MKKITLTYEDKTYTLEFTRRVVENMQRRGVDVSMIQEKSLLILPALFEAAFEANHPKISKHIVEELFKKIKDKETFIVKLAELYNEPMDALMAEPDGDEGNAEWEANW